MPDVDLSKVTLPCPKCGKPMIVRKNKANNSLFMGCTGWDGTPDGCTETMPIPAYAVMKAQGAQTLPGFDV